MALDNRLVVYNEQGEPVDYDILASDVKFLPDGKDLPTKLAELEDEIGQGGYAPPAGGIPKTDLAQSVQDSLDKADSALQDEDVAEVAKTGDYDDLQNKPTIPDTSNLATKTELATKQDKIQAGNGITIGNDDKTVSVAEAIRTGAAAGATAYQKPASGIPASDIASGVIPSLPQNIVQSVTINGGNPVTPDNNGNVDLGNVQGQKGDKGDKGDTVVLDPSQVEQFDIINSLNAQAAGNALDAYQGARLKSQIDYVYARLQAVYAALGNAAFWDGKPSASTILPSLDWSLPKHTITFNLSGANATVKVNGTAHANGDTLLAEEYSTLAVVIAPPVGQAFDVAPTLTFGGTSVVLTANQDGSYSADIVMGQADATMLVTATTAVVYSVTKNFTGDVSSSNTATRLLPNAAFESKIDADNYWQMVDHDFVCMMGSTELPIVLEDGYPVDGSNWASNHVDIQTEDCVIWKCDLISAAEGYTKPYFQVSIKAVTGDIVITGKAVNVLQNNSLTGDGTSYAESGSVANRTGWIHTKRFPLPANINGSGDSTQYCWNFGVIGDNVAHFGCTFRTSQYLYDKTDDATYISGGTANYDICCPWTCRQADGNAGYRSGVTRRTQNRTYRIVALSVHFDSISDTLMTKGAEVGSRNSGNWLIKAGRFLPPTE